MKISKSDLKNIVKECLVELLSEGLGEKTPSSFPTKAQFPVSTSLSDSHKRQAPRQNFPQQTPQLKEAIRRESGGDKILESILADTAASTLPKFLQAGEGKNSIPMAGGGLVEQVVSQANPEDLFGDDVTSKWASLAFMGSPTKK
jgi:hypothetical protein